MTGHTFLCNRLKSLGYIDWHGFGYIDKELNVDSSLKKLKLQVDTGLIGSVTMEEYPFDLDAYFERITYSGPVEPSENVLDAVHRAQLYTIPFENFDILLGRGISLDKTILFNKLVMKSRGGYCFELNLLLSLALQQIGFDIRPLLGRVHVTGTPTGRSHQLNLVVIDGRPWLVDAGFGRFCLRSPLPLELNRSILQDGQLFRLVSAFKFGIMLQVKKDETWQDLYSFDMEQVCPADLDYSNYYTSTHPSSLFTFAKVAVQHTEGGYISLFNHTFKKVTGGTEQVSEISGGQVYLDCLKNNFNIELDVSYSDLKPLTMSLTGTE